MPERDSEAATPPSPWSAILAVSGAGGAALHVVAVLAASGLARDLHPASHAISQLGTSGRPYAALTNVGAMIAPGFAIALSALAAARGLAGDGAPRLGLAALGGAGVGLVVAGAAPFPAPLHLFAALGAETLCAVAIALLARWAAARLGSPAWSALGFACAALLSLDVLAWVVAEGLGRPPHPYMGLEQRAASFAAFGWWGLCALALARRDSRSAAS